MTQMTSRRWTQMAQMARRKWTRSRRWLLGSWWKTIFVIGAWALLRHRRYAWGLRPAVRPLSRLLQDPKGICVHLRHLPAPHLRHLRPLVHVCPASAVRKTRPSRVVITAVCASLATIDARSTASGRRRGRIAAIESVRKMTPPRPTSQQTEGDGDEPLVNSTSLPVLTSSHVAPPFTENDTVPGGTIRHLMAGSGERISLAALAAPNVAASSRRIPRAACGAGAVGGGGEKPPRSRTRRSAAADGADPGVAPRLGLGAAGAFARCSVSARFPAAAPPTTAPRSRPSADVGPSRFASARDFACGGVAGAVSTAPMTAAAMPAGATETTPGRSLVSLSADRGRSSTTSRPSSPRPAVQPSARANHGATMRPKHKLRGTASPSPPRAPDIARRTPRVFPPAPTPSGRARRRPTRRGSPHRDTPRTPEVWGVRPARAAQQLVNRSVATVLGVHGMSSWVERSACDFLRSPLTSIMSARSSEPASSITLAKHSSISRSPNPRLCRRASTSLRIARLVRVRWRDTVPSCSCISLPICARVICCA